MRGDRCHALHDGPIVHSTPPRTVPQNVCLAAGVAVVADVRVVVVRRIPPGIVALPPERRATGRTALGHKANHGVLALLVSTS
jgi:hypothetical protein